MSIRIFRKALGLLIADIVIIIGIFVLQFRTDSSIIEKLGSLQITLEKLENQSDSLKNKFIASYNGITLFCDDQHPVQIAKSDSKTKKDVKLINWTRISDTSCRLSFTDGVNIVIGVTSASPTATLTTTASLPSGVSDIYIPYNYSYNMKVQRNEGNRIIVDSKKNSWETNAYNLANNYICMNMRNPLASYSIYEATVKFTFDAVADLASSTAEAYEQTISGLKNNLIAAFKANNSEASITEQVAISYISAMAERGNYAQAIEEIPQSFKKGKQRTYLSAPFLNTLEDMNVLLEKEVMDVKKRIADAAYADSLEIFTSQNLASNICVSQSPKNVTRIFERAAATEIENISLSQATGILEVYAELIELKPELAQILTPVLEKCVQKITDSCVFDGSVLTISENDTFLSVIQAVQTGIAVLRYGNATGNSSLVKAGRVIVNSYISESSSFDLRTLSNLYPIVSYDNTYYPHYKFIQNDDGKFMWAWTSAKDITYEKDAETGSITLSIDFPEGLTHYVIFKGIPQFTSIYIYNMSFRTDPRFETYNSSGYVYKNDNGTLLLKSRHKSRIETVKLEYDEEIARKRAEEAKRAAELKASAEATAAIEEEISQEGEVLAPPEVSPAVTNSVESNTTSDSADSSNQSSTTTPANPNSQYMQYQYQQQYQHR